MRQTVIFLAAGLFASASVFADVTEEERHEFSLDEGGRISLENINGNVSITGGKGDTVEVLVRKKAGSQKYLEEIEVIIESSDDSIFIDVEHPDSKGWFNWGKDSSGSVSFELTVPSDVNLDGIETVNGDIDIAGVSGIVDAETVNGEVEAQNLTGNVSLETVNGSLNASFDHFGGAQKAKASSVNGRISIFLPSDADFTVDAETINGGIDCDDFGIKASKGFVGRDMNGQVGDGSARLSLETVNGTIKIRTL